MDEKQKNGSGYIDIDNNGMDFQLCKQFETRSEVFNLKYNLDDSLLAAAQNDGNITIYNTKEKHTDRILSLSSATFPQMALRWRPETFYKNSKDILVAVNSDGGIIHWHTQSGKVLHYMREDKNQLFTLDYIEAGTQMATAGADYNIRIYDEDTKSVVQQFNPGDWSQKGHKNRIFSVKFQPKQPYVLYSAGWDSNMLQWDLRQEKCVNNFYGPNVSAESIDFNGDQILTASYRTQNQVQFFDIVANKMIKEYTFDDKENNYCFSSGFSKVGTKIYAVTSGGVNKVKVYDENHKQVSEIKCTSSVYSLDFCNTKQELAIGTQQGSVYCLSY